MRFIDLVNHAINVHDLTDRLADPDVGAHGWFAGVTRRKTMLKDQVTTTKTLFYEAQSKMAIAELTKIARHAADQYSLTGTIIVHRIGEVPIGQASVLVGCSAPHRKSVFEALPWVLHELKRTVPIWKKEIYTDGSTQWVHPVEGNLN